MSHKVLSAGLDPTRRATVRPRQAQRAATRRFEWRLRRAVGRPLAWAVPAVLGFALIECGGSAISPAAATAGTPAPAATQQQVVVQSAATASGLTARDLVPVLSRTGVGPNQVGITLIYAPPLFFDVTGLEVPSESTIRPTLIFILQEDIHEGALTAPPSVLLKLDAGETFAPYSATVTAEDPHHRTSLLLFPARVNAVDAGAITLLVPWDNGEVSAANTFVWKLPLPVPGGDAANGKE